LTIDKESLLYGVRPGDLPTYLVTPIAFGAMAALACLLPARRALRIDSMIAIRSG
jgi:putative ABC transport system permease protein